jgi:hypothetical protein
LPRCAHASLPPKLGFGAFCLSEKCLADIFPLPRCRLIVLSMSRRFSTPRRRRRHSGTPEDAELADILDDLKNPGATTLIKITGKAAGKEIEGWLKDRKNRRLIPHRLEKCGYVPVRNDFAKDGLWKIGTRQVIYVQSAFSITERIRAANELMEAESIRPANEERLW